jgi:hypothetical protein
VRLAANLFTILNPPLISFGNPRFFPAAAPAIGQDVSRP